MSERIVLKKKSLIAKFEGYQGYSAFRFLYDEDPVVGSWGGVPGFMSEWHPDCDPDCLVTLDFQNDGRDELVVAYDGDPYLYLHFAENYVWKHYRLNPSLGEGSEVAMLLAGDFDGDGRDELLVRLKNNAKAFLFDIESNILFLGYHRVQLAEIDNAFPSDGTVRWVITGDFDGDGADEFLVCYSDSKNIKGWKYNASSGNVSSLPTLNVPSLLLGNAGDGLKWFAADLDGDGKTEVGFQGGKTVVHHIHSDPWIYTENTPDNTLHVFRLNGSSWEAGDVLTLDDVPRFLVTGDFNADGIDELAVNTKANDHFRLYQLIRGQSAIMWDSPSTELDPIQGSRPTPRHVLVGDINADGIEELIINFTSDDHFHAYQYFQRFEGVGEARHLEEWRSLGMLDPITSGRPRPLRALLADFNGDSFLAERIPAEGLTTSFATQLVGIVKAPPKQDGMPQGKLKAIYKSEETTSVSAKVSVSSCWALEEGVSVIEDKTFGAGITARVKAVEGSTQTTAQEVTFTHQVEADMQDCCIHLRIPYRAEEYRILSPANSRHNSDGTERHIAIFRPEGLPTLIDLPGAAFVPPANAPHSLQELNASRIVKSLTEAASLLIGGYDARMGSVSFKDTTTEEQTSSLSTGVATQLTAAGVTLKGDYQLSKSETSTVCVQEKTTVTVQYAGLPDPLPNEKQYELQSLVYFSADGGHFVFDHVVPLYRFRFVRNTNTKEVHVDGCSWIKEINPEHVQSFATLEEALADPEYDGCYYCLRAYHRK